MTALRARTGWSARAASFLTALVSLLVAGSVAALLSGCSVVMPGAKTADVFSAAPWRAGERLEYRLRNTAGEEVGRGVLT
ncbi:MAG: hypothetical protein WCL32_03225, partial [Planctomycetota bacterium]